MSGSPVQMDISENENVAEHTNDLTTPSLEQKEQSSTPSDGAQGPTKKEFMIPLNKIEHDEVIRKLVLGGSSITEAQQVIASRKTAFNKAKKNFTKATTGAVNPRKQKNARKLLNQSEPEYGN